MKLLCFLLFILGTTNVLGKDHKWSGVAELNYFIEEDTSYFIPIAAAENESLYFETRYNYEDFNTGSIFLGKRFGLFENYKVDVIPILGLASGQTDGVVPGFEIEANFGKIWFYSQHEYLVDFHTSKNNFYYSWSDLTFAISDSFEVGLSYQRFRPVSEDTDVDAGALVAYTWEQWWGAFYYYAVDSEERFLIFSLTYDF